MTAPRVEIDLDKIHHNAATLVQDLARRGIGVTGVTKAVCGHPDVARAMLDGGVRGLADSRIENVERMRRAGIGAPVALIRTPMLSQVDRIVSTCDVSYNTDLRVLRALSAAALRANRTHAVMLMVEMGDRREGIYAGDLGMFVQAVTALPGLALRGLGANFACLGGGRPGAEAMDALSGLADGIEAGQGVALDTVSGGNSANLPWALQTVHPRRINDLRLGEAILLGVDPLTRHPIEGLFTDAVAIFAEVIETALLRGGEAHKGASIFRSLLAIGRQDTETDGLSPPPGCTIVGATSDHLVIEGNGDPPTTGDEFRLHPTYAALANVMNAGGVSQIMRCQLESSDRMPRYAARPSIKGEWNHERRYSRP